MKGVISDIISVLKSKAVIISLNLFNAIIIARYLGPELNGEISSLLVYPSIFLTFGALGIRKSSAFFIGTKKYKEPSIIHAIIHFWLLSSIVSLVATFFIMFYLMSVRPFMAYILLAILPLPFTLLNKYVSGVFLGRNQIKEFNKVSWMPTLITFISTFIFLIVLDFKIVGVLIANVLGSAIMSFILLSMLGIKGLVSFKINTKIIYDIGKLGIAFAISLLIVNLNYRLDIILMEHLSTKYEIGIYSKGAVLTEYLWQVPMLLGTIVFARGTRTNDKTLFSLKVCQLLRLSFIFIIVASVVLGLFSTSIVTLLFGHNFSPSGSVILYLLPGVIFFTIFKVLHMDISGQGKPLFVVRSMAPAIIVNIGMNIILIPDYGANGAAIASTISYTFGGLLYLWQYSKFTGISILTIFNYNRTDLEVINSILSYLKLKR